VWVGVWRGGRAAADRNPPVCRIWPPGRIDHGPAGRRIGPDPASGLHNKQGDFMKGDHH